jgi:hypothetical protein
MLFAPQTVSTGVGSVDEWSMRQASKVPTGVFMTEQILSQEEIDALLNAMDKDEVSAQEPRRPDAGSEDCAHDVQPRDEGE